MLGFSPIASEPVGSVPSSGAESALSPASGSSLGTSSSSGSTNTIWGAAGSSAASSSALASSGGIAFVSATGSSSGSSATHATGGSLSPTSGQSLCISTTSALARAVCRVLASSSAASTASATSSGLLWSVRGQAVGVSNAAATASYVWQTRGTASGNGIARAVSTGGLSYVSVEDRFNVSVITSPYVVTMGFRPFTVRGIMDITRKRGDTYADEFTLYKKSTGKVADLTGCLFKFTLDTRQSPTDITTKVYEIVGTVPVAANGVVQFAPSVDQANIVGYYYYDVEMTDAAGKKRTIASGGYVYEQDITK